MARLTDKLFVAIQRPLPQHLLTRMLGWLAERRTGWLKNAMINGFARLYSINWQDAQRQSASAFTCFNDFFTRELRPGTRPMPASATALISPCDGILSESGSINDGRLLQAKGIHYPLQQLLGCEHQQLQPLLQGEFTTVYLSPSDYHRVHMPCTGTLTRCTHIPGRLFSVSPGTASALPGLFCRNERLACWFDDEQGKPFVVVLVGAMIVGSIASVWHGRYRHRSRQPVQQMPTPATPLTLQQGAEMGRFLLGSTVIVITADKRLQIDAEQAGHAVKLRQAL